MGIIYLFEHPGTDGGCWFAATYPLGATRYYSTPAARAAAVAQYQSAISATGGSTVVYQVPMTNR